MVVSACGGCDVKRLKFDAEQQKKNKHDMMITVIYGYDIRLLVSCNLAFEAKSVKKSTHPLSHLCLYMWRGLSRAPCLNLEDKKAY